MNMVQLRVLGIVVTAALFGVVWMTMLDTTPAFDIAFLGLLSFSALLSIKRELDRARRSIR